MEFPKPPVIVLCSASALFSAPPETVANALGCASLLNPPLTIQKSPSAELFTPPATTLDFPVIIIVGDELGELVGVVEETSVGAALGLEEGVAIGAELGFTDGTKLGLVDGVEL